MNFEQIQLFWSSPRHNKTKIFMDRRMTSKEADNMMDESNERSSAPLKVHHKDTLSPEEIVDLFKLAFTQELYGSDDLEELKVQIQAVKAKLYNRDYISAFDEESKRTAYSCRWSPSRATAYASLFAHLKDISNVVKCARADAEVLCIGGGAGGELVALASLFVPSRNFETKYISTDGHGSKSVTQKRNLNIHLVDISDWSNVVKRLNETLRQRWLYADESEYFNVKFSNDDILKMDPEKLALSKLDFISLLFTTNELFSENKADSIRLLQKFNQNCKSGCCLLITESAGSYSHITVGTKRFPLQFLVDTILIGKRGEEAGASWSLVQESDSTWYRGDPHLDYPLKVENMRFFYRLYRKK